MSLWAWPNFHNVSQDLLSTISLKVVRPSQMDSSVNLGKQHSYDLILQTECLQVFGRRMQARILLNKYVLKYTGKAFA